MYVRFDGRRTIKIFGGGGGGGGQGKDRPQSKGVKFPLGLNSSTLFIKSFII